MPDDAEIVHHLDLSSRSDRRLLGRAVRENWPVPSPGVQEAIMRDAFADFQRQGVRMDSADGATQLRGIRGVLIWVGIFVAMEGLNQMYEYGEAPKPYRRWRRRQRGWHEQRRVVRQDAKGLDTKPKLAF